jgi:hypothetical protein
MRSNRFVFLNRPMLSLQTHLGVTASPQAPFPADFVTLPVSGKSPPLRLTPSRSRRGACSLLQHRLRRVMHSRHAQATPPPSGRASLAGRTVGQIGHPQRVGALHHEVALDPISGNPGAVQAWIRLNRRFWRALRWWARAGFPLVRVVERGASEGPAERIAARGR